MHLPGGDRPWPDDSALVGALLDRRGDDPRRTDPVAPHHDRPLLAGLVQVVGAERLRVPGPQLEDVPDLDRGHDLDRIAARRAISGVDHADVDLLALEVAPGANPPQVSIGLVRAADEGVALDRLVDQHRHLRSDRADESRRAELLCDLLGLGRPEVGAEGVPELDLVQAVIAAHEHEHHPPALHDHGHRLQQRSWGHAERPRDVLDRGQARCLDLLGGLQRLGQLDRLRLGRGDLDVRRVAGRERHLVLARRAWRHVFVGAGAAHHPDVGGDPVPLEPAAVEDPVVGLDLERVAVVEALLVAVEAVGVLHHELARPEDAGARPRLVALLRLQLVEDQRQVPVGAHLAGDVPGERLLVGHRQDQLRPLPVFELEQLLDLIAAGPLPDLRRLQHRQRASPGRRSHPSPRG